MLNVKLAAMCALGASLSACGGTAVPEARMTTAKTSVSAAEAVKAEDEPQAKLHLKMAQDAIANAEQQIADNENEEAEIQFAYLADRTAQKAQSHGNALYLAKQTEETDARYNQLQKTGRLDAEERLDATQERMEQQSSSSKAALAQSESGRKAAEARAASAIASLNSLANVKEEANRTVITLSGSVLFKTGESTMLPLAQDTFTRVATALKEMPPGRRVAIEGHTDSRGDDASNQQLSQARAQAVMDFLVQQGVDAKKMSASGKGESMPVASNDTPEGRANNRRVELIIEKWIRRPVSLDQTPRDTRKE
jgi:outer membrane protein OmpA-like peptidoglycan-associated protein